MVVLAGALKNNSLEGADKAFFTSLVYGTVERKISLDYNLSLYLKQPLKKLHPKVYTALLLGAYQILFMDRIPDHAAINESVKLVKKNGASFGAKLVNAVLHKVAANGMCLPEPEGSTPYRSILYSCPEDLVELWTKSYGAENADGIMAASLGASPVVIRVNTVKTTAEELAKQLEERGIKSEPHPIAEDSLVLEGGASLENMDLFHSGLFHVQDASSQLCIKRLDPQPGETVFDVCAAPGGKSFTIAERMQDRGTVKSFDLYEHRTNLIKSGAERLGLSCITAETGNAEEYEPSLGLADRVLCDVPCAGLGVIGRKPEIRYKSADSVDNLPPLQYRIFCNSIRYLRVGGTIVYSTCSLNPAENEEVVNKFLKEHSDFELVSMETLLPHITHTDGFFISVLKKKELSQES